MPAVFATGEPGSPALHTELDSTAVDNLHRYADSDVSVPDQVQRGE